MFMFMVVARAPTYMYLHITLPHITHLTAKPSRMIGVQVGVWCVARALTLLNIDQTAIHSWSRLTVNVSVVVVMLMFSARDIHKPI